jgi:hypothetical protein
LRQPPPCGLPRFDRPVRGRPATSGRDFCWVSLTSSSSSRLYPLLTTNQTVEWDTWNPIYTEIAKNCRVLEILSAPIRRNHPLGFEAPFTTKLVPPALLGLVAGGGRNVESKSGQPSGFLSDFRARFRPNRSDLDFMAGVRVETTAEEILVKCST